MSVASTPAPQASEDMVVIENVSKVFKSGKENLTAVDNVSLTVRRGEIFAIKIYCLRSDSSASARVERSSETSVFTSTAVPAVSS